MRTSSLTGRQMGQICAAAITAALVLLCAFSWFRYDRSRTLHYALEKAEGDPILFSEESGFFTGGVTVELERNPVIPRNIEIHYTIDGNMPTADSPLYEGGIDLAEAVSEISAAREKEAEEEAAKAAAEEAEAEAVKAAATEEGSAEEGSAEETAGKEGSGEEESVEKKAAAEEPVPTVEESRAAWRREKAQMRSDSGGAADPAGDGITVVPVRACLIQGEDRSRVVTRTYVIGSGVFERYSTYVACLTADSGDLFDYDSGILIKGSHYQTDLDSGKRPDRSGNYYHTGEEWTRDAHVTLFSPEGEVLLEEDGGLSVAGYSSRNIPTKSLRLEAMPEHGSSGDSFALDIFSGESTYIPLSGADGKEAATQEKGGEAEAGESAAGNTFRKIKFRTHGTPEIHIRAVRAEYAKILSDECGFPGLTENRLGVTYLNGEFYTLCDIAPTATREYLSRLFGLSVPDAMEKFEGNDYDIFTRSKILRLLNADLTKEENCARLEEAVDMDNYLFYYALEILLNNSDWPFNNIYMWRYLGEENPANPYTDGRFRFVLDDMDQILTNDLHSMPEHWSTEVFDYLMKDEGSTFHHVMDCKRYRDTLLTYIDDLLRTTFEPEHDCRILRSLYGQMKEEYIRAYGEEFWEEMEETRAVTEKNIREKESLLRGDIEKYLGLKERYTVRMEADEGIAVSWNNQHISPGETWTNTYYCGTSFDVQAEPLPGYRLSGWEVLPGASGKKDAAGSESETGSEGSAAGTTQDTDLVPDLFTVSDALTGGEAGESAGAVRSVTIRAVSEKVSD